MSKRAEYRRAIKELKVMILLGKEMAKRKANLLWK